MSEALSEANHKDEQHSIVKESEVEAEANFKSSILKYWFPIARVERKFVSLLAGLFFIITLIYSVSRDVKDALVITHLDSGSIQYLKVAVVLPFNILFVALTQKLLGKYSLSAVFQIMLVGFASFFMLYGILLMSIRTYIEPSIFRTIDTFLDESFVFRGLEWTRAIYLVVMCYITSLVYLAAELFGAIVLSFLFLSVANEVSTRAQSFRMTTILLFAANCALICSGLLMQLLAIIIHRASYETGQLLTKGIFVGLGISTLTVLCVYRRFNEPILRKKYFHSDELTAKRKKIKMGILEGLLQLFVSKVIFFMALIVIAYSIIVNMVECPFKSILQIRSKDNKVNTECTGVSYVMYTNGQNQVLTGFLVILVILFRPNFWMAKFGWLFISILLPIIAALCTLVYFPVIYNNVLVETDKAPIFPFLLDNGMSNTLLESRIGKIVVPIFKVMKYSGFDISKEAFSMRLEPSFRAFAKSITDGVCTKVGKALGSLLTLIISSILNTTDARKAAFVVGVLIMAFCIKWSVAVFWLAGRYDASVRENKEIEDEKFFQKKVA